MRPLLVAVERAEVAQERAVVAEVVGAGKRTQQVGFPKNRASKSTSVNTHLSLVIRMARSRA
jgi:hypothetical protein